MSTELPVVTRDHCNLVCPVCAAVNQIREEEKATQLNVLVAHEKGIQRQLGNIIGEEHERYFCKACGSDVDLPDDVED